jgi:aspartyl-tRNA(Asn)/glutamyl-tRNA(Gln) amidotransferase subunit A
MKADDMTDEDLCFAPATELARRYRDRTLSPRTVMAAVLARIAAHDRAVNAFVTVLADQAMAEAEAAERRFAAGSPRGPLDGIPVTVKDLTLTRGIPTQYGSPTRRGFIPDLDAPIVTRLRDAGAIIIGKTTTPEFGWIGTGRSPLTGLTHTPWRIGLTAGGSSAGAGAAAAAGFGALHQGSDAAGSVRLPAHFCGVFGLKPSFGRIPIHPVSNTDYTSHLGPLARSVADAALMLKVMAGPHDWDHTSLEAPPADYPALLDHPPARPRLAYSADFGHARVDPEVAALARAGAERLAAALGVPLHDVTPPWGKAGPELIRFFWPAHWAVHAPKLAQWRAAMDPGFVACIEDGMRISVADYQLMRERKYAYIRDINIFFEDWDFLLSPAASVAAFPSERLVPEGWPEHPWDWLGWAEFSYPFDLSGNPAASVPTGFTADGLPVGLQIAGRRFDDLGVLQISRAFERAAPWADRRPSLGA